MARLKVVRRKSEWWVMQDGFFPIYIGITWRGAMDAAWRRIRRDAA